MSASPSPPLEFKITDDVPVYEVSDKVLSREGNIMTAAIISILVVILFVLFLHIYAKYVLLRHRQPQNRSIPAPQQIGDRHFRPSAIDANRAASPAKGLEPSAISSIPVFVYNVSGSTDEVVGECAICLSVFEADELCRRLPGCGHAFHVECIDTWFHSHSTCPICRSCPSEKSKYTDPVVGTTLLPEVRLEVRVDGDGNDQVCNAEPSSSSVSESSESVRRVMSRNRSERKIHPSEALVIVTM